MERSSGATRILHRFRGRALDVEALSGESVVLANGDDGTLVATTLATGETRAVTTGLGSRTSAVFELGRVGDEAVLVCRGLRRIERYAATGAFEGGWDVDVDVGCTRLAGRGRRVVFSSETTLWALDGDGPPVRIGRSAEALHTLALGPNDTVATASLDGTVTIWQLDPAEARLVRATVVTRHDGAAFGVALSPDGGRAASAGYDQRVRIASLDGAAWVPPRR